MTREEAANVLWWASKQHHPGDQMDITERVIEAFDVAIVALRGPQPDPITGLMPCGCGGVTEQTDFHDGFFPYSRLECLECGIQMMRAGDTFLEAHAEVKRDWDIAMGWKGGAE